MQQVPDSETVLDKGAGILAKPSTALLVIHGIGEQNPYETLDQFARNLHRYLGDAGIHDITVNPYCIDHNDWSEVFVRLQTDQNGPSKGAYLDVHEYYWASATEGKMSYKEVLSWLLQTTLRTIRRFNENVEVQKDEANQPVSQSGIVFRELFRICLLYLPLLGLIAGLYSWLSSQGPINRLTALYQAASQWISGDKWRVGAWLFLVSLTIVLAYIALGQIWRIFLRTARRNKKMSNSWWVWAVVILGVICGWAASLLGVTFPDQLRPGGMLLLWLLLAKGFQAFLANFLGDVAIYTNADAKAKNYAARQQILSGATRALTALLKQQELCIREIGAGQITKAEFDYDQVIIAGHSLGTVVAYDAINSLCNHERGGPDQIDGKIKSAQVGPDELAKITGLVTFGSPLDKVYYFFRDAVPVEQTIRGQILSYLHSFRKNRSMRDYAPNTFQQYAANDLPNCKWFNAWSLMDPISGALHFYRVNDRRHFWYLIPFYAHLSYWEDLRFYDFFARPLLLGAKPAPQKAKAAYV